MRSWFKALLIPLIVLVAGCQERAYMTDNKQRLKSQQAKRTKYNTPGQSRAKTGNFNDGY